MRAMMGTVRAELVGAGGVVERNAYLTKRYIWWDLAWFAWTVANTLTIVFIAKGIEATGGSLDVNETMTTLLIGADLSRALTVAAMFFVREYPEPSGPTKKYTTTWFDMFRIVDGKIAEHWDPATK